MARKRKSKSMGKIFHNETTVDGIKFDSETEAKYYMYIRDNKEKLNIKEIELQPEFLLQNKYILTPDGRRIDYINDKQFKKEQKKYPKCTHQSIKYNQIDWSNKEQKLFVAQFIGDKRLRQFLTSSKKKSSSETKAKIYEAFNFVAVTYGSLSEEDILSDLYVCFMTLMKRYKQTGKNFCAYVANVYHYEVSRHIKKFTSNPLAVNYKTCSYEDSTNGNENDYPYEDTYYESSVGLPDYTWINGETCGAVFDDLTTLQRKILVEYYMQDYNDGQIGEHTATNIGTVNGKRRKAINDICGKLDIDPKSIPRQRKNGRK